jgi:F-type H+-transporting ATPase subunit delta
MSQETVARRYASALADVVLKTGETELVRSELKEWESLLKENPSLVAALRNPSFTHAQKEKVLSAVLQKTNPSRTTANFLRVLGENGRVTELPEINERFALVLQERQGGVSARVESARELSENEKLELRNSLEKMTGKKVSVGFSVEKDLIGGVVTTVGSTVYDSSVKTQLANLKQQLVNG